MSTYTSIKKVERDLKKVNDAIDARIVKGLSYKVLGRQHKALLEELRALKQVSARSTRTVANIESPWSKGIMTRLAQYASVFLM